VGSFGYVQLIPYETLLNLSDFIEIKYNFK